MRFNSLPNLIGFAGKAHGEPPVSGCVTNTRMPDGPVPSQGSFRAIFSRYIPLSAYGGGLKELDELETPAGETAGDGQLREMRDQHHQPQGAGVQACRWGAGM